MKNKCAMIGGLTLVLLGLAFLVGQIVPNAWPLVLIAIGTPFLVSAMLYRVGGLAIPGVIIGGLGLLLGWQALTEDWASWFYAWPLLLGLVGLGLVIAHILGTGGRRIRTVGVVWLVEGIAAATLFRVIWILFPVQFTWPFILVGLGAMFLLAAVLTGVAAKAIPGVIVGGLGCLLCWQNLTGAWQSWSYAWALVPCFVGLGLVLANLLGMGSRTVKKVGWSMVDWSLVLLVIGGLFFAFDGALLRYWPALLILGGVGILARPFLKTVMA
jgi:hypothetical protein